MAQICQTTILQALRDKLPLLELVKTTRNQFGNLIIPLISQNTANINNQGAFQNLSKRYKIKPLTILNSELNEIEDCSEVYMLKKKAQTISFISKILINKYNGSINPILSAAFEEARKPLCPICPVNTYCPSNTSEEKA